MRTCITLAVMTGAALCACTTTASAVEPKKDSQKVVLYPAPEGMPLSKQYAVKVSGTPIDVYEAPVWDPSVNTQMYGDVRPYGGPYSFAYFDFDGRVDVEISTEKPLDRVRVLPQSRGVQHTVQGNALRFSLDKPCQLSIEPNAKNGPLLLFANPLEKNPPKEGDPGVVYFGPGMHKPCEIKLSDNQTLYIAGGAVVKGGILAQGSNIRIAGRGIIDGLDWQPKKFPTENPVCLMRCNSISVEGIIVKDSPTWTFTMFGSRNVRVDNVKICSTRCPSGDGFDIVNSQKITIENCFLRTDDDCIAAKGFGYPDRDKERDGGPVEDVTVSHCTLWTDRAHSWRLGGECWAEGMRRFTFKDIDVLHSDGPLLITVEPSEDIVMEDVLFEDIRVNGEGQGALIQLYPPANQWVRRKKTPGNIRNVTFKNITVTGESPPHTGGIRVAGIDANHTVEGITFDNVTRYGARLTRNSPNFEIGQHTHDIVVK